MEDRMAKMGLLHFSPGRIVWIGLVVLGLGFLLSLPFVLMLSCAASPVVALPEKREKETEFLPLAFSLGLNDKGLVLPIPELQGEMTFSFDPPRPVGAIDGERLLVRMKKRGESKRVVLPCRIDLEFQGDQLVFAKEKSSFWIELAVAGGGQIEGKGFITSLEGERMEAGSFLVAGQDCPIQAAQEFPEGSPFRLLAEARWWGRDQFMEQKDGGERMEIGAGELLEVKEGDWLIWKDQKWEKCAAPEKDRPIAHIQSFPGKALVLEGWDVDGHIRLSLTPAAGPTFKVRGEDLLSSIRIRSEKQISCMLEKQCMVLKTGDWVLKLKGRWKILRKKEERDAFLNGKLFGELFVFEQISQKQGQKMIQGRLFNPGRTQVVVIEMAAQSTRQAGSKSGEKGMRKGRVP